MPGALSPGLVWSGLTPGALSPGLVWSGLTPGSLSPLPGNDFLEDSPYEAVNSRLSDIFRLAPILGKLRSPCPPWVTSSRLLFSTLDSVVSPLVKKEASYPPASELCMLLVLPRPVQRVFPPLLSSCVLP